MNRPYTICYMNTSAEGHIDGRFSQITSTKGPMRFFREKWIDINAQAIVYGSKTMAMLSSDVLSIAGKKSHDLEREDTIYPAKHDKYYVVIDPTGTLSYPTDTVPNLAGRGEASIIHVLIEDVSDMYINYLNSKKISYIFCGKDQLDVNMVVEKLYDKFNIEKMILGGGAITNWTFLKEGLIDELRVMYLPYIDGNPNSFTLFKAENNDSKSIGLKLASAEIIDDNGLLVTYIPDNKKAL